MDDAASKDKTDRPYVTLLLPDEILKKRNAAHIPTVLILLLFVVIEAVLLATQSFIPFALVLVLVTVGLAVSGKAMTKKFMSGANHEMAKFLTTELGQSDAFEHALYESLSNEVFTRVFRKSLSSAYEMEYLAVPIKPAGEPPWAIRMLRGATGYELRQHR
ncbi:hypothetical protein OVA06_01995 [Pseudarthrobacter sp. SL88]|uniref:hypothetical protein n=1 Tax=Pseudarthrobacter sp. SL88 TaxID=2994666 RepID=UPI002274A049|nr:hypothetical protein [Pseudarthrobacter sp. SL88]MCY1673495.1 hypothetical protein [Pseudarthrobacter sp. SL88]